MKTNIEGRKPFIFEINEIKSGRVQEVGKGGGTKSLNFLHLWVESIFLRYSLIIQLLFTLSEKL